MFHDVFDSGNDIGTVSSLRIQKTFLCKFNAGISVKKITDNGCGSDIIRKYIFVASVRLNIRGKTMAEDLKIIFFRNPYSHITVNHCLTCQSFPAVYVNPAFPTFPVSSTWSIRCKPAFLEDPEEIFSFRSLESQIIWLNSDMVCTHLMNPFCREFYNTKSPAFFLKFLI